MSQRGYNCVADVGLMLALIVIGWVATVQIKYKLATSKMDGAGFVPLFQEELTKHLCRVEQIKRDGFNETELLTVIEKDANTLNAVILSNFDFLGALTELVVLLPILGAISLELTLLVIVAIPFFLLVQLRQGVAIVDAAKALRGAEFTFMRSIEENLVFTVRRAAPALPCRVGGCRALPCHVGGCRARRIVLPPSVG